MHKPISASCTPEAKGFRKTTRKRSGGTVWPRRRAIQMHRSILASCTTKAKAFSRITRRRSSGTA